MNYELNKLKNGLKYLLIPNKCHQTLSIILMVKCGSVNEPYDLEGISHFIEHMFFQGTKEHDNQESIVEIFNSIGVEINAFTSNEITVFYLKIGGSNYKKPLELLSEIIRNSLFTDDNINNEKRIILNEIEQTKINPLTQLQELMYKKFFRGTHLELPVIGRSGTIRKFDRIKLLAYVNYYYQPKNMLLIASGNLDNSEDIKIVFENTFGQSVNQWKELYFNDSSFFRLYQKRIDYINLLLNKFSQEEWDKIKKLEMSKTKTKTKSNKEKSNTHTKEENNLKKSFKKSLNNSLLMKPYYFKYNPKLGHSFFKIVFQGITSNDNNTESMLLLQNILLNGMSSRLFKRLRSQEGLIYNISSTSIEHQKLGALVINFSTRNNNNNLEKVFDIIKEEINKLINSDNISDEELNKVKNMTISKLKIQLDNSYLIGLEYGFQIIYGNKTINTINQQIDKIEKITDHDIINLAKQIFNYKKMMIFNLGTQRLEKNIIKKFIL
jgi:predicted Zn-dependent peptidase